MTCSRTLLRCVPCTWVKFCFNKNILKSWLKSALKLKNPWCSVFFYRACLCSRIIAQLCDRYWIETRCPLLCCLFLTFNPLEKAVDSQKHFWVSTRICLQEGGNAMRLSVEMGVCRLKTLVLLKTSVCIPCLGWKVFSVTAGSVVHVPAWTWGWVAVYVGMGLDEGNKNQKFLFDAKYCLKCVEILVNTHNITDGVLPQIFPLLKQKHAQKSKFLCIVFRSPIDNSAEIKIHKRLWQFVLNTEMEMVSSFLWPIIAL